MGFSGCGTKLISKSERNDYTGLATSPLSGLPLSDQSLAERRAIAVKVENAVRARPQSGPDKAEVVYEELCRGGIDETHRPVFEQSSR